MAQPSTTMTYGSYSFSPVPLFTYTKDLLQSGDGTIIGETHRISLAGELVITSGEGSLLEIDLRQDDLRQAFSAHGQEFRVKCGSNTVLLCYPRVVGGVNFEAGIWVNRAPFTIDLEFDEVHPGSGSSPFISNASDEWQVEILDDRAYHSWELPNMK